ncbi:MAG: acyl-CoA thioesterase [Acidimicrobiales bacterium]|nr:acyl-CoA thioesterase [Acidimicrobiales bacterium]
MDADEFLGLRPTHNPHRWFLEVTPGISTGGGFLFGGAGLGAAISALEQTTGRPLIWATAQYLSYAMHPAIVDLDVTIAADGRNTAQARAVGHVADREIFTVNAALGRRDKPEQGQWAERPNVPGPESAPPRGFRLDPGDTIMSRMDVRLADARDFADMHGVRGTGRAALWARMLEPVDWSAAMLAIVGDYVPFGIGQALGVQAGGNSLDNTLRVVHIVPTDWVLVDIRVHGIHHGFGHGTVHLWADDGTLMATASQSTIVRHWTNPERPGREPGGAEPARTAEQTPAAGQGDGDPHLVADQEAHP